MIANRLFNLIIPAVGMGVVALAVQQAFATKAFVPNSNGAYTESKEQALREYQLEERYEELRSFSAEQIRGEYILGEQYGETLQ